MKTRTKNAIETRLATEPQQYGSPLQKTLHGYWKLLVGVYRVILKSSDQKFGYLELFIEGKYMRLLKRGLN